MKSSRIIKKHVYLVFTGHIGANSNGTILKMTHSFERMRHVQLGIADAQIAAQLEHTTCRLLRVERHESEAFRVATLVVHQIDLDDVRSIAHARNASLEISQIGLKKSLEIDSINPRLFALSVYFLFFLSKSYG